MATCLFDVLMKTHLNRLKYDVDLGVLVYRLEELGRIQISSTYRRRGLCKESPAAIVFGLEFVRGRKHV